MRSVNRPQFAASSKVSIDGAHEKKQQSQLILTELRARAVRMILEHEHAYANQSAAIMAIAPKIGCGRDTLRRWIKQSDIDSGRKEGQTSDERAQIKAMEREIRDLRQANEILRKASAYFAQAQVARPFKR